MTFIAQFAPDAPLYVQSPQQEAVDLPDDHVWTSDQQFAQMTNGLINTENTVEVGHGEIVKGTLMSPLRFTRENDTGEQDTIEVWYSSELMRDGQELEFYGHTLLIREV